MSVEVVNQDSVLSRALDLVASAQNRIWITSPWITQRAVNLVLRDVLPKVRSRGLEVRIVYRVKEPGDLDITDLEALKSLEDAGCQVRYSTRLHAKLLLVDTDAAIVSSSNLTATAGYSVDFGGDWRNEELGVLLRDEDQSLADLEQQFSLIWDSATSIGPDTVGIVMDFPNVQSFSFVAIRDVRQGSYVTANDGQGNLAIGQVAQITAYNRSFPHMGQTLWLTQGYAGAAGDRRGSFEVPDLQELFSHPSKDQGFLVTKTFFEPESVFRLAKVDVLKHLEGDRLVAPSIPVPPGADVLRATTELLGRLLGDGDVRVGTVLHHPEVAVSLRGSEILSKHLAVLGMTGSDKSNAVKVLVRELLTQPAYRDLRVVIVDTHGEYAATAQDLAPQPVVLDVVVRRSILDEGVLGELLTLPKIEARNLQQELAELRSKLPGDAALEAFLARLAQETRWGGPLRANCLRLIQIAGERADLCLEAEQGGAIVGTDGRDQTLDEPGLYILNLRNTAELEARATKVATLLSYVFRRSKEAEGGLSALIVLDEAQNYAPEQQTGWLSRVRPAFDAVFAIASEGRKFGVGLVVSSQRPARVNKDVLSQCNSHMIFRVANSRTSRRSQVASKRPAARYWPSFPASTPAAASSGERRSGWLRELKSLCSKPTPPRLRSRHEVPSGRSRVGLGPAPVRTTAEPADQRCLVQQRKGVPTSSPRASSLRALLTLAGVPRQ